MKSRVEKLLKSRNKLDKQSNSDGPVHPFWKTVNSNEIVPLEIFVR